MGANEEFLAAPRVVLVNGRSTVKPKEALSQVSSRDLKPQRRHRRLESVGAPVRALASHLV